MKELIRRLINWAHSGGQDVIIGEPVRGNYNHTKVRESVDIEDNRSLNFRVYNASGGKIVQMSSYDARTDRMTNNLYIITDQEDMATELSQIITRESLSR